jgi:3-polyprenyl-4-hydroxybenzoate decarboxylase
MVVVVDPDIDVRNPDQVEWAIAFRSQPARDVIIIDDLPGGTLDPSIDGSIPLNRRVESAMGIDATYPFGADEQKAADVPAGEACGPAVAEHGHKFFKVAAVFRARPLVKLLAKQRCTKQRFFASFGRVMSWCARPFLARRFLLRNSSGRQLWHPSKNCKEASTQFRPPQR